MHSVGVDAAAASAASAGALRAGDRPAGLDRSGARRDTGSIMYPTRCPAVPVLRAVQVSGAPERNNV